MYICNWPLASTRSGRGLLGSDSGELPELGDVTVDSSILSTRTLACLVHWLACDRSGRYNHVRQVMLTRCEIWLVRSSHLLDMVDFEACCNIERTLKRLRGLHIDQAALLSCEDRYIVQPARQLGSSGD